LKTPVPSAGERATQARYQLMQLAAEMEDVVRLGAGDPDLHTPGEIVKEAVRLMGRGKGQITEQGLDKLREAISEQLADERELDYAAETNVLITNGAQEALFLSMLALVDPGDRVLVQDPRYSSYDQAVEAAGGKIVAIPPRGRHDFCLDPDELVARAGSARVLVFVNPNNPTAALHPPDLVRSIARIADQHDLVVLSDEVYDKLTFDSAEVLSIAQCERMRERTVVLSSFSKTYAMTGFRVGYLAGPAHFIQAVTRLKQAISGPCPLFSQYAALAALTESGQGRGRILETFAGRRRIMLQGLDSLGIPYGAPGGGFFIWADISKFGRPAHDFCLELLREARVLMFPGTAFGEHWKDFVRISILEPEERLEEGIKRLGRFTAGSSEVTSE